MEDAASGGVGGSVARGMLCGLQNVLSKGTDMSNDSIWSHLPRYSGIQGV